LIQSGIRLPLVALSEVHHNTLLNAFSQTQT
jgi:hypothetical protein